MRNPWSHTCCEQLTSGTSWPARARAVGQARRRSAGHRRLAPLCSGCTSCRPCCATGTWTPCGFLCWTWPLSWRWSAWTLQGRPGRRGWHALQVQAQGGQAAAAAMRWGWRVQAQGAQAAAAAAMRRGLQVQSEGVHAAEAAMRWGLVALRQARATGWVLATRKAVAVGAAEAAGCVRACVRTRVRVGRWGCRAWM